MSEPVDWDATTYPQVAQPHDEWGGDVLYAQEMHGDETDHDAGRGGGRETQLLLDRLTAGRLVRVDGTQ